jgi:uncharacterized membrane protein
MQKGAVLRGKQSSKIRWNMTWLQRYRFRHYLRNSIWVYPVLALLAGLVLARVLIRMELDSGWVGTMDPDSVRAVLGTLAGSIFTFIVFICSSLLLVVQLASAQLTPRMIGVLFENRVTKLTLAMFVFVFSFSLSVLVRIEHFAPPISANIAGWSAAACICLFIYLIDHIGKLLRPSGALRYVALRGHKVIESVYPRRLENAKSTSAVAATLTGKPPTHTVGSPQDGVILAFDIKGIVALAVQHAGIVELVPQVGNYVAPGDPLFRIHDAADFPVEKLLNYIAIGMERTMEQDPAFALRVIVDIASKGLSPAINDPTTAVLAIDRIQHLLRHLGRRQLDDEKVRDQAGNIRLLYRTPNWEDFVALGVTEIRQYGGSSIQITRRLRGMLENLIKTLPEERSAALRQELKVLQKSAERFFTEPEDRAMADVSDSLGVGGTGEHENINKAVMS